MMKQYVVAVTIAVAALVTGCYEKADVKETAASGPLYRHHFVGMNQLLKGTNAIKVKEIWGLKSTPALRDEILNKLAVAPREFWRKQLPTTATDQKELIRPLLDDVLNSESYLDIKGPSTRPEGALAVRLSPDRMTVWNNNLTKLAAAWTVGAPEAVQAGNAKGWTIKRKQDSGVIQVMQAGEWMLVGIGQDKLTLLPGLLAQTAKASRPVAALSANNVLSLDADLPHLKNWFPFVANAHFPPVHADVFGDGEYLRTKMSLRFSEKIPWKPEPWSIPTELISEPLCGFTVGQGIAPLLPGIKGVSQLGLRNYPNQFCIWSESTVHFLTFVSAPVPKAANVIREMGPKLSGFLKEYYPDATGQVAVNSNLNEVAWMALPVVIPFLRATNLHGTDYIVGGVLPAFPETNSPPPAELFKQFMNRNNLMYYDWEITQQSLAHSRQFWQLQDILNSRDFAPATAPTEVWMTEVASHLGNAITEVTQSSPNELTLTRKSHLGLTGSEIVVLSRWLRSSTFPFGYEPPAKMGARPSGTRPARTNQPNRGATPPPTIPALPVPR